MKRSTLSSALYNERVMPIRNGAKPYKFPGIRALLSPLLREVAASIKAEGRPVTINGIRDVFRAHTGHTAWIPSLTQWVSDAGIKLDTSPRKKRRAGRRRVSRRKPAAPAAVE